MSAEAFQRDGACVVRGLLEEVEVARLREGVEQNLGEPSERAIEGGGEDGAGRFFEEGTFENVPDVEADRDAYPILGWALEPGDAVAFNMLTLHAAAGSRNRRRAFSVRLIGDDVRFALRPHATSPPFPRLR
jgi:hypothetical protein